ncbi:hypothetical protein [Amycolatopsis sp. NPDC004625]
MTAVNWVLSLMLPPVSTTDSGRPWPSVAVAGQVDLGGEFAGDRPMA